MLLLQALAELKGAYEATLAERLADVREARDNAAAALSRAEAVEADLAVLRAEYAGLSAPFAQVRDRLLAPPRGILVKHPLSTLSLTCPVIAAAQCGHRHRTLPG